MHSVKVLDTSSERKTAENVLEYIRKVVGILENEWLVEVVGGTSDESGEAKKARRLYGQERPEIMLLPCYAHQVRCHFFLTVTMLNE